MCVHTQTHLSLATVVAVSMLCAATSIAFASEETNVLAKATATVQHFKGDPAFGSAKSKLSRARGILIIPASANTGINFRAEAGKGVLVRRAPTGWSQPAFYSMGSASSGPRVGFGGAEVVMVIMNDRAMSAVQTPGFKLGASGLMVVPLTRGGVGTNVEGDIVVWTPAGAYGGLPLNGSEIKARDDWNTEFYGRQVSAHDIFAGRVQNPYSSPLRSELAGIQATEDRPVPRSAVLGRFRP